MPFEAVETLPDSYFGVTLSRVVVSVFFMNSFTEGQSPTGKCLRR